MRMKIYKVYEVTPEARINGVLRKCFRTYKGALNYMNKSIFRYIKEDYVLCWTL